MDGLKLPGNASKRWSGTLSDIRKKQEKIEQKVKGLLEEQISRDKEDHDSFIDPLSRQKQIDKLRKQAERIERWLEENDAKIGSNGRELQSNVTDNESAKMMTSHGTIQGYNAQALVDKEHQVRGISDGSGICYDKILFINSLTTVARRNGCFAFAYRDRNSSIHVVRQIDIALKQELWKK